MILYFFMSYWTLFWNMSFETYLMSSTLFFVIGFAKNFLSEILGGITRPFLIRISEIPIAKSFLYLSENDPIPKKITKKITKKKRSEFRSHSHGASQDIIYGLITGKNTEKIREKYRKLSKMKYKYASRTCSTSIFNCVREGNLYDIRLNLNRIRYDFSY